MRLIALVFVLVMLSGCAAGMGPIQPTASSLDWSQLVTDYRAALTRDEELARISATFSISDYGTILGTLEVNKKAWADLSWTQRGRIIRKATDIYARQFAASPVSRIGVSSVTIKDDMGSPRGWIIVCTCGPTEYLLYGL